MEHCRKRTGHAKLSYNELEDELEYNLERKDTLKKQIKKLEDEKEDLRLTNWKNVKYTLEIERENEDLKARIKELEQENIKVKNMSNIDQLKSAESKISQLKATIESDKNEAEEIFNNLRAENQSLKAQIKNFLKCDDFSEGFEETFFLKSHILSNHSVGVFICDNCRETFSSEDDLKTHATEKQSYKTKKQILIEKRRNLY